MASKASKEKQQSRKIARAWALREILKIVSDPGNKIFKDILPHLTGPITKVYRAAADLAEVHAKASRCSCGHEIAKLIMDAAPKAHQ